MFKSNGQIFIFAAFFFCGVLLGLWYWLTHLAYEKSAKVRAILCDALFGAGLAALVLVFFFFINGIQLRWFCFLGLGLGVLAYVKILGQPLDNLKLRLYNRLKKIKGALKCRTKKTVKKSN